MKAETQKTYLQGNRIKNSYSTFIGSALLIVATLLPCLDRILSWMWPALDVITDSRGVKYSVNIWIASVYLAPAFIAFAAFFKPNKKIYYFPLTMFAYSAIVYYSPIFGFDINFLRWNSFFAGIIACISTLPIMLMLNHIRHLRLEEKAEYEFYEDYLEEIEKLNQENEQLKNKLKI